MDLGPAIEQATMDDPAAGTIQAGNVPRTTKPVAAAWRPTKLATGLLPAAAGTPAGMASGKQLSAVAQVTVRGDGRK